MRTKQLLIISLISFFFISCLSEEGEGGTGSVQGYVYHVLHPDGDYTFKTDTIPASEVRVYIQYGDEKPYSDDMRTGSDGFYKFKYLTKGTYSVFAYSEYPDGPKEAVEQTVTISKGGIAEANMIFIHSGKMLGRHQIKGQLKARYYSSNNSGTITLRQDTIGVAGERIYIRKKGVEQPFDDVRTGEDGVFIFEKVPAGAFEVYALSEDAFTRETYILGTNEERSFIGSPDSKGIIEVTVTDNDKTVVIKTIYAFLRS